MATMTAPAGPSVVVANPDSVVVRKRVIKKSTPGFSTRARLSMYDAYHGVADTTAKAGRAVVATTKGASTKVARSVKTSYTKTGFGLRRAGRWILRTSRRFGRMIWNVITAIPRWGKMALGWITRGASVIVQNGLAFFILGGVIVMVATYGLIKAADWIDAKVHKPAKKLSRKGKWGKAKKSKNKKGKKGKKVKVQVTKIKSVEPVVKAEPAITAVTETKVDDETATEVTTENVDLTDTVSLITVMDKPITYDGFTDMLRNKSAAVRDQAVPDDLEDSVVKQLWEEMAAHYEGKDDKTLSYYAGREMALGSFLEDPTKFMGTNQRALADQGMKMFSAGQQRLNKEGLIPGEVRHGMTDEIKRLKAKLAAVQQKTSR